MAVHPDMDGDWEKDPDARRLFLRLDREADRVKVDRLYSISDSPAETIADIAANFAVDAVAPGGIKLSRLVNSLKGNIVTELAASVSASLTQVLRWACWWSSTEAPPEDVTREQVVMELNTDFSASGMSAAELTAVVKAWQSGALSRNTILDLFRRGEILPEGRTNEEEATLIPSEPDHGSELEQPPHRA